MNALYRKVTKALAPRIVARRKASAAWVSANLPEVLAVGGASGITVGAGQLAEFAAWVVGGSFSIASAVLVARGRENQARARRERER